jgi:hypothetical protein
MALGNGAKSERLWLACSVNLRFGFMSSFSPQKQNGANMHTSLTPKLTPAAHEEPPGRLFTLQDPQTEKY